MQVNDFENYLKIHLGSKNSIQTYMYRMKDFFTHYQEFDQTNVNAYLARLVDHNLKSGTFNLSMTACKHYSRFLKINIDFPKQKKVIKNKHKKFLTMKELEQEIFPYFDCLFSRDSDKRKLVLRLLFTSGLRPIEAVQLHESNIDWTKNYIHVINTKDKENRITYLCSSIQVELKKELQKNNGTLGITKNFINYTFAVINNQLNYKMKLNPYILRHSFAHHVIKQGIGIKQLKELMGHWDLKMTEEYLTLTTDEIMNMVKKKFKYKIGFDKKEEKK